MQETKTPTREKNRTNPLGRGTAIARQEIRTLAKPPGFQEQVSFSPKGLQLTYTIYMRLRAESQFQMKFTFVNLVPGVLPG